MSVLNEMNEYFSDPSTAFFTISREEWQSLIEEYKQQQQAIITSLQTLSGEVPTLNRVRIQDRINNIVMRLQRYKPKE